MLTVFTTEPCTDILININKPLDQTYENEARN